MLPPGGDGSGSPSPGWQRPGGRLAADSVRLGELERHLGDGAIENVVDTVLVQGRLRRRLMSYPLVIRLMS